MQAGIIGINNDSISFFFKIKYFSSNNLPNKNYNYNLINLVLEIPPFKNMK